MNKNEKDIMLSVITFGVLQIMFILLKLSEISTWSWWKTFIPSWAIITVIIINVVVYFIVIHNNKKR